MCYGIPYLVTRSTLFPLAVLICPLVALIHSLVALIYQLVVLVYPFVSLLVVSACPLVALHWPFVSQLIVLVVLSVGIFLTDRELSLFIILSKVSYPLFYHTSDCNSITVSKKYLPPLQFFKMSFCFVLFPQCTYFQARSSCIQNMKDFILVCKTK